MRLIFFIILLQFSSHLLGQNTETDSLKKDLAKQPESPARVNTLQNLSYAYLASYPDTAMMYALEGLQLAQKIKDLRGEAYCVNSLANVYFNAGDYPQALEMYFKSLKIKEEIQDQKSAFSVTYFNIANVYTEQKDYQHALDYLYKTQQIDEKAKDTTGVMFDFYSLANIYSRMNNADSALYYVEKSNQLAKHLDDRNMFGAISNTYAGIYFLKKDYALARQYYRTSIAQTLEINDNEVLSSNYHGMAEVLRETGEIDSAIFYLKKGLEVAKNGNFLKEVMETGALLKDVYKSKQQYDSAFKYFEIGIAAKDSMFNSEKIKKVQNLKLLEQQRQHDLETANIKFRNKVRLYIVIFASVTLLGIALWLWRNNRQKQEAYALLKEQKLKTDEAYHELKLTQDQLIHSEKMASLGELTAGIAHEIQNPLNFVNNFSEVNRDLIAELKDEIKSGNVDNAVSLIDDIAENENKITFHGKRADAIVKGMLQHSRTSSGHRELVDINEMADEYLRLAYHGLRAKDKSFNATLKTAFDTGIPMANVAREDIGRAVLNLLNNAFHAVRERQKAAAPDYQPTVTVSTKKTADRIELSVMDNGTGISPEIIEKIFQPFFTTKPTGQGTGLGLSLSYDIVKSHGGDIKLKTKENEGSEFVILLPVGAYASFSKVPE